MSIHRKRLGEGLTDSEKKEFVVNVITDLMKEGYHLTEAVRILQNYYCGAVNIKKFLDYTKFDFDDPSRVVAIVFDGENWVDIKAQNFIFLASQTLASLTRDVIAKTGVSIYDAACIILDHLQIPLTEENLGKFGKIIKSTLWKSWIWEVKDIDTKKLWSCGFSKYKKQIEFYSRHGNDIKMVLNRSTIEILGLQLEKTY